LGLATEDLLDGLVHDPGEGLLDGVELGAGEFAALAGAGTGGHVGATVDGGGEDLEVGLAEVAGVEVEAHGVDAALAQDAAGVDGDALVKDLAGASLVLPGHRDRLVGKFLAVVVLSGPALAALESGHGLLSLFA
jgi:hypothetical protein